MSTEYKFVIRDTSLDELFDGRLERFGITEKGVPGSTAPDRRCLTDGTNCLWAHPSLDRKDVWVDFPNSRQMDGIVNAIEEAFGARLIGDYDPDNYWGIVVDREWNAAERAWVGVEQYLLGMKPSAFRGLVASVLRAMVLREVGVAQPREEGGIDILAWNYLFRGRPSRINVQIKRQPQAVSVEELRSFIALLGENDFGLLVSICGFSKDAADEAETEGGRKVMLVSPERLYGLWVEHYCHLSDEARRCLRLRPVYVESQ